MAVYFFRHRQSTENGTIVWLETGGFKDQSDIAVYYVLNKTFTS